MSAWRSESVYLGRYAGSGVLNTLAGFAVIFLLMVFGISPVVANVCGYSVGLMLGFFVSKKFVFRSEGAAVPEGIRYLAAFFVSFALNLAVLKFSIDTLRFGASAAQVIAAASYTTVMYVLTRWVVFRTGMPL